MIPPKSQRDPEPVAAEADASSLAVPIGSRVVELLEIAYRARRPVLLEGPTGIGKSQIVEALGRALGIDVVVLDLSLLEPPDLVGLPVIEDGCTRYARPAELPVGGAGVLMLEELNRAELPVMQPALQLLSARRLHGYALPPGWSCVAAVNPEGGDYRVQALDPALRSRFLQLEVCADRDAWLAWATGANVHPVILGVVRAHADALEHASPRSWAYASDVLHAMHASELASRDLVRLALRGYLPPSWALAVTSALAAQPVVTDVAPERLLAADGPAVLAEIVASLEEKGRADAIAMLASKVRRVLASELFAQRVETGVVTMLTLESLLAPFPGDLREQCLESAVERAPVRLLASLGHDAVRDLETYATGPIRETVRGWTRDGKSARVRLVTRSAMALLAAARGDATRSATLGAALAPLVGDAGPVGGDLARWMSARGLSEPGRS